MKDQKKEIEYFTAIAQSLLESLASENLEDKWEIAVLDVTDSHDVTEFIAESYYKGETTSIFAGPIIHTELVSELKAYTEASNYTPWNKFKFTLTKDHKFNIDFEWDQQLHDKHEDIQRGNY